MRKYLLLILLLVPVLLTSCGRDQDSDAAMGPDLLPLRQGVFRGSGVGFMGDIQIEAEVESGGRIVRIDVVGHEDTPGFAYPTFEIMRTAITESQSTDVALITGATATSRGFRDAVEDALVNAGVSLTQLRPGATPAPRIEFVATPPRGEQPIITLDNTLSAEALAALPASTAVFTPGTYTATVRGYRGAPMTVQVSFSENRITGVDVLEHGEALYDSAWALRALPAVPDQILVRQSTLNIDAFSGATGTRDAVISAVENTIRQANAQPARLIPQFIDSPLPGDRFIPGYIEITVPANTMDMDGNPLVDEDTRMLYCQETDMNLRLSFGRNEFHLHFGGAFDLGQGYEGHGESIYEPGEVGGGALGGWWFRQVVNHQVNDRQTTLGVDIATGATMSASAIVWGVEQAMIAQGANPEDITPITYPPTRVQRSPQDMSAPFFIPGIYTVITEGSGGPMVTRVTFDRTKIRRIEVLAHSEIEVFWSMVWGAGANHVIRDRIFAAGPADLDYIDVTTGATRSSDVLVNAVRAAVELALLDIY